MDAIKFIIILAALIFFGILAVRRLNTIDDKLNKLNNAWALKRRAKRRVKS